MKNAPTIDLNNSLETPIATDSVPSVNAIRSRVNPIAAGNTIVIAVKGRNVTFTCKVIEAGMVEKATMPWAYNIRNQELLTEESLADLLPTIRDNGQQVPAFGREINGVTEVADGSRRRMTTIIAKKEFKILVGDLTDDEMEYLSSIGNDYRAPSAYERGKVYERRLKNEFFGNQSQLSEAINVDRKIIRRCLATATLPIAMVKLLKSPNELSGRAGEALAKVYEANRDDIDMHLSMMAGKTKGLGYDEFKELFSGYSATEKDSINGIKLKPRREKFSDAIYADYKGRNHVVFTLKDAPEEAIREVEKILAQYAK